MKVVFLDIDGVLNSQDNANSLYLDWMARNKYTMPYVSKSAYNEFKDGIYKDEYGVMFDQRCVRWLELFVYYTDAIIVISSDWRKSGFLTMQKMWKERNLPGEVIATTNLYEDDRLSNINAFVAENIFEEYVVLDDIDLAPNERRFIKVKPEFGINRANYFDALSVLNSIIGIR